MVVVIVVVVVVVVVESLAHTLREYLTSWIPKGYGEW